MHSFKIILSICQRDMFKYLYTRKIIYYLSNCLLSALVRYKYLDLAGSYIRKQEAQWGKLRCEV
jgi:hypothetical protein